METRDYHNEIRAERDKLREELDAATSAYIQELAALETKLATAIEALLEARAYVPEHHGPVNHKIETALAAISDA